MSEPDEAWPVDPDDEPDCETCGEPWSWCTCKIGGAE